MAEHLYTYINPTSKKDIQRLCRCLENDGVIAYPTDVNWAFGCDASSPKAINRIRQLKPMHPRSQPFSLICNSFSMISDIAILENHMYRFLRKILPGPYTFLLKRSKNLPKQIKDKRQLVGVRYPESPLLLDLIEAFGKPLATTSLPQLNPTQDIVFGYQVDETFGHGIDYVVDLGEEVPNRETSIIDLTADEPQIVRNGVGDVSPFDI